MTSVYPSGLIEFMDAKCPTPPAHGNADGCEARDCAVCLTAFVRQLRDEANDLAAKGLIAGCPHGGIHAMYCGDCCAQFDPRRMVLVHSATCRFNGHERSER